MRRETIIFEGGRVETTWQDPEPMELMTRQQIQRLLQVSKPTFYRLKAKEGFPTAVLKSRWIKSEVEQWVREQR
jgi:predicted DNA-binding transcriptional regulator AlpA